MIYKCLAAKEISRPASWRMEKSLPSPRVYNCVFSKCRKDLFTLLPSLCLDPHIYLLPKLAIQRGRASASQPPSLLIIMRNQQRRARESKPPLEMSDLYGKCPCPDGLVGGEMRELVPTDSRRSNSLSVRLPLRRQNEFQR